MISIKRKGEGEYIDFENCHGGAGTVHCLNMLNPEESEYGYQWFHYDRIPDGTTIAEHPHEKSEEIYYILEGEGTLIFDGVSTPMGAGDISMVSDGHSHGFENNSGKDVIMIVVEIRPQI